VHIMRLQVKNYGDKKLNILIKYYAVVSLSAAISALSYLLNQPVVSEASVVSAILVGITFALHDLEQNDNQSSEQTKGGGGGNPSVKVS
jgi:small-conductance mechanosensitive channel